MHIAGLESFQRLHAFYLLLAVLAAVVYGVFHLPPARATLLGAESAAGGVRIYAFNDGVHGREPWRSDGTAQGTFLLRDIRSGIADSDPEGFLVKSDAIYFKAYGDSGRMDIWRSDGSREGTVRVTESSVLMDGSVLF